MGFEMGFANVLKFQNWSIRRSCLQWGLSIEQRQSIHKRGIHEKVHLFPECLGNGPNTVSGSTVSNTELSEFFGAH